MIYTKRDYRPVKERTAAEVSTVEPYLRLAGAILSRAIKDAMLRSEKREIEALMAQSWLLTDGAGYQFLLRSTPAKEEDWRRWVIAGCPAKFEEV